MCYVSCCLCYLLSVCVFCAIVCSGAHVMRRKAVWARTNMAATQHDHSASGYASGSVSGMHRV